MPGTFIDNDLAAIFVTSEFADTALYKAGYVTGIFDDDDIEAVMGEGVTEIIPQPTFTGRTADFTNIADGDTITIRSEVFTIRNWKREDVVITVYLERTT